MKTRAQTGAIVMAEMCQDSHRRRGNTEVGAIRAVEDVDDNGTGVAMLRNALWTKACTSVANTRHAPTMRHLRDSKVGLDDCSGA